jgi:hypothetical protein
MHSFTQHVKDLPFSALSPDPQLFACHSTFAVHIYCTHPGGCSYSQCHSSMRISQEARAQANAVKEAVLRIRKQSLRNREEECFCSAHITRNSYAVWTEEKGDEAGSNQMLEQDDGNRRDSDQDETNQQSEQGGGDRDPGGHEKKAHDREVQHRICPEEGYQGETKPGESSHNDIGGKEGEQDKPAEVDKLSELCPQECMHRLPSIVLTLHINR